ncbi:androgen-dependent TFPI-regulating protein-like [Ornithodoros turicata]|uniref:androgen-dependent TFPI-regulating protein-like n=1 Tax=Ornithodoros turicata TaxID=34597 RepID=UPI0031393767
METPNAVRLEQRKMLHHTLVKTFHIVTSIGYLYMHYYCEVYLDVPYKLYSHRIFGRYKYLTHWNLTIQTVLLLLCCIADFAPPETRRSVILIRDHLFLSLAMPLSLFVTVFFWTLYHVDRDFVFPDIVAMYYPVWVNHALHSTTLPILLLEASLHRHRQPKRSAGFATLMAVVVAYISLMEYLGIVHDVWVYPVLEVMEARIFVPFVTFSAVVVFVFYIWAERINIMYWPDNNQE